MTQSTKCDFGVIGLAVMGSNLARNIESRGYKVAVFNRTYSVSEKFMQEFGSKNFSTASDLKDYVNQLERPRKILIMVQAGAATDAVINSLLELLDSDDIIIDGGNAWYEDTQRREKLCSSKSIRFIGMGISGGEEGALLGPSLMPGGPLTAWNEVKDILIKISAKVDDDACVTHIGPDGAGHFVKMVHNGIEYADMQLIAETYHLLKSVGRLSANELADTFLKWNKGPLASFLIEITEQIFRYIDVESQQPLVELILDKAGQKGTGRWTSTVSLELGVSAPSIAAAVDARVLSSMKLERQAASSKLNGSSNSASLNKTELVAAAEAGLYAAKIIAYAQGLQILKAASDKFSWQLNLSEIAKIWRGGCIIRARLLAEIMQAYKDTNLTNLMLAKNLSADLNDKLPGLRKICSVAAECGIPTLALSASLGYFDSYRSEMLPQNLTQAQRDFFGAHTYERVDLPGVFHTEWK